MEILFTTPGMIMILASVVSGALALYVWRKRRMPGGIWFFLVLVASCLWGLLGGMEDMATGERMKIILSKLSYPAVASEGVLWLTFITCYLQKDAWLSVRRMALLWIIPACAVLGAMTNEWHGLLWPSIVRSAADPASRLTYGTGPLKLAIVFYSYALMLIGTVLVVRHVIPSRGIVRKQFCALAFSSIIPWAAHILYMSGYAPDGLDVTPVAFTAMGLIISFSLFRYGLFDIMPVAYDLLFHRMSDGALVLDNKQRLVEINAAAQSVLGIGRDSIGTDAGSAMNRWPDLITRFAHTKEGSAEVRLQDSNDVLWFDVRISRLADRHDRALGQMYVFSDITIKKRLEEELTQFATTDTLTGSFNRRMGYAILDKQIRLVRRMGAPLSVCFIDLDNLKHVNDTIGHEEGDRYITMISRAIRDSIGELDSLCRLGGDEFLVILPQCTAEQAGMVWHRAAKRIEDLRRSERVSYAAGASCGIAELKPGRQTSAEELVAEADKSMYLDKKARKAARYVESRKDKVN
jgi:diguanylate cyclase (GGDEF)-like protein